MGFYPKLEQALPIIHCLVTACTTETYSRMFVEAEAILKSEVKDRNATLEVGINLYQNYNDMIILDTTSGLN